MTKINTTTAPTSRDLGNPTPVPLAGIALDPNNPRIAPNPAPGYENAKAIFADDIQAALVKLVYKTYNAGELEDSIIDQGWTPVDQIIVWPHPSGKGFIVVEGNTRVSLLKQLPGRLAEEEKKLARMRKAPAPNSQTRAQEILIGKIETLIAETATLWVRPVLAKDAAELMEKLPRLLGVRHVVPAKSWKPYATNLYVISLYESAYARKHGPDEPLRIEREILDRVAEQLPLKREDIRRQIQAVSAFTQFKLNYEDKIVEAGNKLDGRDQYYFDNILKSPHARVAFDFKPDDLELSEEAEEALFTWAFSKPRGGAGGDDEEAVNENVFQKAEDIRLWQKVARYDASDGMGVTNFANRLDIQKPEGATPVWRLEREAASHRERNTPVKAFDELLKGLKDLKLDTLLMQAEHLRPMLAEARKQVDRYIKVIDQNTDDK